MGLLNNRDFDLSAFDGPFGPLLFRSSLQADAQAPAGFEAVPVAAPDASQAANAFDGAAVPFSFAGPGSLNLGQVSDPAIQSLRVAPTRTLPVQAPPLAASSQDYPDPRSSFSDPGAFGEASVAPIVSYAEIKDGLRAIPRGLIAGLIDEAVPLAKGEAGLMGQFDLADEIPGHDESMKIMDNVLGLYEPTTGFGKVIAAGARAAGNPVSYVGPIGGVVKGIGSAFLGGVGSELAGNLAEGTQFELPARIAGNVAGGVVGNVAGDTVRSIAPFAFSREVRTAPPGLRAAARKAAIEAIGPSTFLEIADEGKRREIAGGH